MKTHYAVGLTTTILTTLIGSLGEEALLAITQDPSAIIQVENPHITFYTSSFPFHRNDKDKDYVDDNDNYNDNDNENENENDHNSDNGNGNGNDRNDNLID